VLCIEEGTFPRAFRLKIKMKTWILLSLPLLVFGVRASAQTPTVFSSAPTAIIGQAILQSTTTPTAIAPNLVEGRELFSPQAVAVDNSASPPILYIADTQNNRILVYKNALGFATGAKADLIIGQSDFFSTSQGGPSAPNSALSQTGLASPTAVLVDGSGNLYVADSGNNRVVRFPQPTQQTGSLFAIDLVIGQKDQNSASPNQGLTAPTAKTLALTSGSSASVPGWPFKAPISGFQTQATIVFCSSPVC